MREFAPLARKGDEELLARCAAILRIAEQLERPRDQTVRHADVVVDDGRVELKLRSRTDATVSRWGAQRQGDLFKRAFGRELEVTT
jgi:exopolyphosphatase/guanosine-5'-triphosphate,3'-diphosphate pyrophosphatase